MESTPAPSPLLPWEVIERIISHSWDPHDPDRSNPESIRNFSLTCRELRPRSLCFVVADAVFSSRNQLFNFCDFLQANPHLKPFVRSICVHPTNFAPVPLLRILPNLSQIEFTGKDADDDTTVYSTLNQFVLTSCQLLSMRIHTLSLSGLKFATSLQFFRLLSAFTKITHLACSNVLINNEGDLASVYVAKQRLSQRLRLLNTLHISYSRSPYWEARNRKTYYETSVGTLLVDSGLVQSTIESLTVEVYRSSGLTQKSGWPRLCSLTLKLWSSGSKEIADGIMFLKDFQHLTTLKEVTVKVYDQDLASIPGNLTRHADLYKELERTMLRFSHAQLVWSINVVPIRRNSFWTQELEKCFPTLAQRGTLTVVPHKDFHINYGGSYGTTLAISPDNRWAVSGSTRLEVITTAILWDIPNGGVVQRWAPHKAAWDQPLWLAFSPNSQYLVSGTEDDAKMVIWDLPGGSVVHVLEGHTSGVSSCAWSTSPRGDVIASGSCSDTTIRLWDANTFQPLHVFKPVIHGNSYVELVKFSPDGRWLLTGSHPCSYYLWDVVSGAGQQLRAPNTDPPPKINIDIAAAFDPGSTRFIIISPRLGGMVEILDTEGVEGSCYVVLGASGGLGGETRDVAFSPDGNLVLTVPNFRARMHAIRIWDAYTGIKLLSLEGHEKKVWMATFSPCGKYVASASDDCTVRLWRTSDGSCVATLFDHRAVVYSVVFSPDGKTLVSGDDNPGSVIIRQMCDVLPIDEQDL